MIRMLFTLIFSGYRKLISPLLPRACRFYPSCSAYSEEAIKKHGVVKGIAYGISRLCRCHPWHDGGYDPVPAGK